MPSENVQPRLAIYTFQGPDTAPAGPKLFKFRLRTRYPIRNKVRKFQIRVSNGLGPATEKLLGRPPQGIGLINDNHELMKVNDV